MPIFQAAFNNRVVFRTEQDGLLFAKLQIMWF